MTIPTPPYAALDGILRQASHLLLDLDGPVCTLYTRKAASLAADELRAILAERAAEIPATIAATADPLAVLAYAAAISPSLAERAEAELTRCELAAVATAQAAGYSHDVISSAREGHRTVTVISTCSVQAVQAYLDRASLDELVGLVIGRTGSVAEDPIGRALSALSADPATCALVATSPAVLNHASAIGVGTIVYAPAPATPNPPAAAIGATVTSLADLVLRLRAHPLPN